MRPPGVSRGQEGIPCREYIVCHLLYSASITAGGLRTSGKMPEGNVVGLVAMEYHYRMSHETQPTAEVDRGPPAASAAGQEAERLLALACRQRAKVVSAKKRERLEGRTVPSGP